MITPKWLVWLCDDKDYLKAKKAILAFAKKSHRAADLGIGGEDE